MRKIMNGTQMVKKISQRMDVSKKDAKLYFTAFLDSIMVNLDIDERVVVSGFGSFKVKEYKARVAKNPINGELMQIPIRRKIRFKPGKELRERVNAINIYETEYKTIVNNVKDLDNVLSISAG
jgi:nucleoid DNA-binding protein